MSDLTIHCPACQTPIQLTEQLAGPLVAAMRERFEARLAEARRDAAAALAAERDRLAAEARAAAEAAQAEAVAALRAQVQAEARARAQEAAEFKARLGAATEALQAAQRDQAEALKRQRALEAREAALQVEIERRVNEGLTAERERMHRLGEEALAERLRRIEAEQAQKLAEKDTQMEILRRQIETLQRKADQGSMQVQGEAAETVLEDRLRRAFPGDEVQPVARGARGADILQAVGAAAGRPAGRILWEVKAAQNWSPAWLAKLRADQRAAGAEVAVLVAAARPAGVDSFAILDGVHVCAPAFALPLAAVLRQGLAEVAEARSARDGQATKMELLYAYLTGTQFRGRIGAIAERFAEMQDELAQEKRLTQQRWARRERQIEAALTATLGLHGDLQGIAGRAIPSLEGLEPPPALPAGDPAGDPADG
jgi:hypothetical protein